MGVEWVAPGREGRILRVQVKSTVFKRRGEGYSLNVMGPQRERYPSGMVDFFAVYLIPIDAWYIIPYALMGRTNCSLHFTPNSKRHKYVLPGGLAFAARGGEGAGRVEIEVSWRR